MSGEVPNFERIFLQPFAGEDGGHTWCSERIENEDIEYVRVDVHEAALLAVRKEGIEEAAGRAQRWLEDWGQDLDATFEEYVKAQRTGTMNGRRIKPEQARAYAGQFKERADAVYDCGSQCATAIRQLLEVKG